MKLPALLQFGVLKEALKALFTGPYTTKFPYKPIQPTETFKGKPEFNEEECVGCAACCQVCPAGALSFRDYVKDGKPIREIKLDLSMCIFCGQCQLNCLTEKGIQLSKKFDLAITGKREEFTCADNVEKELVVCEDCGEIILPKDQFHWVIKKLGALAFSNTSLIVFDQQERFNLGISIKKESKDTSLNRHDRIKILCPKCRREAILKS